MKPMFLFNAGEYLTGSEIEKKYRNVNLWVPAKDSGIDLLVSDRANRKTISLQVKLSKDYLITHMQNEPVEVREKLRACGWWTPKNEKLHGSRADYWVLVLQGFANKSVDYIVIPPQEFERRLRCIHPAQPNVWQVYLWVTKSERCWETRGLPPSDRLLIANDTFSHPERDFRKYLNAWEPVALLNGAGSDPAPEIVSAKAT